MGNGKGRVSGRVESHQEGHGGVEEAEGWPEWLNLSPEDGGQRRETANLSSIAGTPGRFLAGGGLWRRGGPSDAFISARGSLEQWRHGEERRYCGVSSSVYGLERKKKKGRRR
jgi:hypothetical protein